MHSLTVVLFHLLLCSNALLSSSAEVPVASNLWKLLGLGQPLSTIKPTKVDPKVGDSKALVDAIHENTINFEKNNKILSKIKMDNLKEALEKDKEIEMAKLENLKLTLEKNKELAKAKVDTKKKEKEDKLAAKIDLKKEKVELKKEKIDLKKDKIKEKEKEKVKVETYITPGIPTTKQYYSTEAYEGAYEKPGYAYGDDDRYLKPSGYPYGNSRLYGVRPPYPSNYAGRPGLSRYRPYVQPRPMLNRVRYGLGHPAHYYTKRRACADSVHRASINPKNQ